jgi:nanoRNase/pAp phosphatase (c-di-AMP/oligoRNAs hydrolase)
MSYTITEQINKLLENKKRVLIVFQRDAKNDSIASALALFLFLEKFNKNVEIVCDNFNLPNNLRFLKNSEKIKHNFSFLKKFVISVDVEKTGVKELSYDLKDEKLKIYITPKQGYLDKENIKTAQSDFKYDLIFVLNTTDLTSLGSIYEENTELFFGTPIVNIDYKPSNEYFGQINMIDMTLSSTSEVIYNLLQNISPKNIDEDIATAILTGIISETKSFKSNSVKPQTLELASKLISMGAKREEIIENLYRTRTISMMKLWGHTLTQIKHNKNLGLIWSTITREDFIRCNATKADIYDIADEIINTSPDSKITLILHEDEKEENKDTIHAIISTNKNCNVKELVAKYNPEGTDKHSSFKMTGKTLSEAEIEITEHLQNKILIK